MVTRDARPPSRDGYPPDPTVVLVAAASPAAPATTVRSGAAVPSLSHPRTSRRPHRRRSSRPTRRHRCKATSSLSGGFAAALRPHGLDMHRHGRRGAIGRRAEATPDAVLGNEHLRGRSCRRSTVLRKRHREPPAARVSDALTESSVNDDAKALPTKSGPRCCAIVS